MSRPLKVTYHEGDAIPEALLRELWELRLEMLTLTRPRDADWEDLRR